jgi:antirestriction protein ArdC
MSKFNIYSAVTERIIAQLEQNIIPWRKTWSGSEPINYISRKPYRGINLMLLPFGGEYATFKQIQSAGGKVKKGEKSHMVVYYNFSEREKDNGDIEKIPFLKYYNVFHISQCEGITSKLDPIQTDNSIEPIETAQNILDDYITRSGVTLQFIEGSNRAFYQPSSDTITMPIIGQFESAEEYYSTTFHEAAHSTGNRKRLNRAELTSAAAFGSQTYSKEELVAEISAATVMNFAGIELSQTFENSVAYIKSWLAKLRSDNKMIISASSKAQKSTDLILNIKHEAPSAE